MKITKFLKTKGILLTTRNKEFYFLLIPSCIIILLFSFYPLLRGVYLGFTNYKFGVNKELIFTGLDNFFILFKDRLFFQSLGVTVKWVFFNVFFLYIAGLFIALLLNVDIKFKEIFRCLTLVPWVTAPVVRGLMWRFFYNPSYGVINVILKNMGIIDNDINWLGSYEYALPAAIFVNVWSTTPFVAVALLAGLQTIDLQLYETASLDGANIFQKFIYITLPQLKVISITIIILLSIWTINAFDIVYVLTGGGPGGTTNLPMLLAYNEAFKYGRPGYAAAIGNFVLLFVIFGLGFSYLISKNRKEKL